MCSFNLFLWPATRYPSCMSSVSPSLPRALPLLATLCNVAVNILAHVNLWSWWGFLWDMCLCHPPRRPSVSSLLKFTPWTGLACVPVGFCRKAGIWLPRWSHKWYYKYASLLDHSLGGQQSLCCEGTSFICMWSEADILSTTSIGLLFVWVKCLGAGSFSLSLAFRWPSLN